MKNQKSLPSDRQPLRCEVTSCQSITYKEGLCPAHYKLSRDPAVRIALEDLRRRQELDRLTGKRVPKAC